MFGSLYSNFNYKNLKLNSKKNVIQRQVRDHERTIQNEKNKIDAFNDNSTATSITHNMKLNVHDLKYDNTNVEKIDADKLLGMDVDFDAAAASIINNSMYDKLLQMTKKTNEFGMEDGMGGQDGGCSVTIDDVYKKNIRVICNVYQPKYKDNINVTGFGDFIRGCYFLLQFCEQHDLQCRIIVNHPIAYFLQQYQDKIMGPPNKNIKFFINNNWSGYFYDEKKYIHSIPGKTEDILCSFMSYLVNDIGHGNGLGIQNGVNENANGNALVYLISYPFKSVSEKHKKILRHLLEPRDFMKKIVSSELSSLGLVMHDYTVIHIRTGDQHLNWNDNGEIHIPYFEKLVREINDIMGYSEVSGAGGGATGAANILLISDSMLLKKMLKQKYPMLKMLMRNITHLGEGSALDHVKIQNTLSDFYLFSFSKVIYSFSCYEHGTGFSQWCACTYNIPYFCKYVT